MNEKEQQDLIPMSPGERLRSSRQARKLTEEQVARQLKCSVEVIRAIEDDHQARLAPVYRKGFVRSYAEFLGIDPTLVQFATDEISEDATALRSVFPEARAVQSSDRWLRAASYALASLLVGTLAWQVTHEAARLARHDGQDTAQAVGTMAPPSPHVSASVAALESFGPPIGAQAGAGRQAWQALASGQGEQPLAPGQHRLELRASADSWIEINDSDGTRLERDLVRGGEVRQYAGTGPFDVSVGRASSIQMFMDGEPVDLLSHAREDVARLRLDPAMARAPGAGTVAESTEATTVAPQQDS